MTLDDYFCGNWLARQPLYTSIRAAAGIHRDLTFSGTRVAKT